MKYAAAARRLHAYVGQLVADEYDLEGINEQGTEFRDIFFDATRTPESSAPLN